MAAWARRVATRWYVGFVVTALQDGMPKEPRLGMSAVLRRGAGGMGGRPGVERWAVLEGRRVGRLFVRWPSRGVGPSAAARSEVEKVPGPVLLFAGGE